MSLFRCFSRKHGRISKGALERSLYTKQSEISPRKLEPGWTTKNDFRAFQAFQCNRDIVTLDPNKIAEMKQKCLHIGNIQTFRPHILLLKHSTPVVGPDIYYDQTRSKNFQAMMHQRYQRYPPDTKAYLYYYMSPERPRIAGELRLRVTSNEDPASFGSGSDLLLSNGRAWTRPLYSVSKYYPTLYDKLRDDRLIPDDLDAVLSTLPTQRHDFNRCRFFYTFNDTFITDFSKLTTIFFVVTEQGVEGLPFNRMFYDGRGICKGNPYTGTALVRIERSTLPGHKGTRTVVLRFLKMITPVKCVIPSYDGYISLPKEGELHQRFSGGDQSVWSINIDESRSFMVPGLRLLWDA